MLKAAIRKILETLKSMLFRSLRTTKCTNLHSHEIVVSQRGGQSKSVSAFLKVEVASRNRIFFQYEIDVRKFLAILKK